MYDFLSKYTEPEYDERESNVIHHLFYSEGVFIQLNPS